VAAIFVPDACIFAGTLANSMKKLRVVSSVIRPHRAPTTIIVCKAFVYMANLSSVGGLLLAGFAPGKKC